jgi:hypothetical protein
MDNAAIAGITIMRGAQYGAAGVSLNAHIVRTGNNRAAAKQPSDHAGLKEMARRAIVENNGRVRRGGARDLPPILLVHRG